MDNNTAIHGDVRGCPGTCTASVYAPALAVESCESSLEFYNFTKPLGRKAKDVYEASAGVSLPPYYIIFGTGFQSLNGTTERIALTTILTGESITKTCAGKRNITTCYLVSAVAEYRVEIANGILHFVEPPSYPRIIALANNTAITSETVERFGLIVNGTWTRTTLSGIMIQAALKFGFTQYLAPVNGPNSRPLILLPVIQSWFAMQRMTNYLDWDNGIDCAPFWNDPRSDIMAGLNELMFRTGVYAAHHLNQTDLETRIDSGLDISYNVSGTQTSPVNVFVSDFSYFAGAAAVQVFTIAIILFTFYGWWRLGRHVTFSPLEVAKVALARV